MRRIISFHFFITLPIISRTFVLSLTQMLVCLSVHVILSILVFMLVYAAAISISTLFTLIGVLSITITFLFAMFIVRPLHLISTDSFLASVVVLVAYLCIRICHQQSGDW